jgi:hypothetical protein
VVVQLLSILDYDRREHAFRGFGFTHHARYT